MTIPGEDLYEDETSFFDMRALNPFTPRDNVKLPKRDVSVWLPAEYDLKEFEGKDFPILYCHDGQNGEYVNHAWCFVLSYRVFGSFLSLYSCVRLCKLDRQIVASHRSNYTSP